METSRHIPFQWCNKYKNGMTKTIVTSCAPTAFHLFQRPGQPNLLDELSSLVMPFEMKKYPGILGTKSQLGCCGIRHNNHAFIVLIDQSQADRDP